MIHRPLLIAVIFAAYVPALAQTTPAAKGPQPLTRAAFMQRLLIAHVALDTNKDGFTDRAEIESAGAKELVARKAQRIRAREADFRTLDTNKDGSLTLKEFNAIAIASPLPKANAAAYLGRLDANKDGKVSLEEGQAPALARFDLADTNKDGIVSVAEQRAAGIIK